MSTLLDRKTCDGLQDCRLLEIISQLVCAARRPDDGTDHVSKHVAESQECQFVS